MTKPHNPWEEFLNNCATGDNHFRYSEYQELIDFIDCIQAENAALKAEVEELDAAVTVLEVNKRDMQETIAQQAEALRVKDEALKEIDLADDDRDFLRGNEVDLVAYALAIQPNPDILRERDARLVERIAGMFDPHDEQLDAVAMMIRNGEWK